MIIRVVENKFNKSNNSIVGEYISIVDNTVYNLKKALNALDKNLERIKSLLQQIYEYLKSSNIEIQSKIGLNPLHETRYSQFKKQTTIRNPSETVHRAIREVYKKVKELRKIIEFAGRMKMELNQGNQYKKRTSEAIGKLSLELKEISTILKKEWKT